MFKKIILSLLLVIALTACSPAKETVPSPVKTITELPQTEYSFTAETDNISAYELTESSTVIETQQFDFGSFITSINGVAAPEGSFWSLYLNGEQAQVGANDLYLKKGDSITWKLENVQQ